ncbi:protein bric-a-brac 1-like [Macrosteles quadrilineatus]|uniref:protein bric-a-brac 1-like n=1 Tax=Macrosteles quadrilineatus TaxID=74068 RepID=UPI0023E0AC83|nr:protein bric-a-brac 1-like [Macrosteles quadrilineatus]
MGENKETKREEKERERAQTSPVWSYFKVCEDNAVMADCLLCGIKMSRGGTSPNRCGTTNLRRHILYAHNIHLPSINKLGSSVQEPSKRITRKTIPKKLQSIKKNSSLKRSRKKTEFVKGESGKKEKGRKEVVECETQPEPVMCIKWNTYVNNMTTTLPQLLQDEQFVDVTLACEGQSLRCHKILLAACSPYFYDLLSAAACKHPIIMFKDYRFWELQALVAFMYCGEVNVPQSQLPRILRVAEALQIKGLAKPATKLEFDEDEVESSLGDVEPQIVKKPQPTNKRKRKPSPQNCCKNPTKTSKAKLKQSPNISRRKLKSPKKKTASPAKKPRLLLEKKNTIRKPPVERDATHDEKTVPNTLPLPDPLEQNCSTLPELLHNDMPDMLNDILAMRDTDGITEGISLPGAHKVGSVDSIFPLGDIDGPFLSNGLNGSDHFDLINPECRLGDDDGR